MNIISSFKSAAAWLKSFPRAKVLLDKTAWLLLAPSVAILFMIDAPAAKTLLQWSVYGVTLAGLAVVISRLIFPQIDLTALVESALRRENIAAGLVSGAIILFVGILVLALVMWAKA